MKKLADNFTTIDAKDIDIWFEVMMAKFYNCPMYNHLLMTYMELTGETAIDKSLKNFLKKY